MLKLEGTDDLAEGKSKEKRMTLWVDPGRIHYLYIVDGKEVIDDELP